MAFGYAVPFITGILVGLLLGFLAWQLLENRRGQTSDAGMTARDDMIWGLMVLSSFGIFLTRILVGFH
jgi:F0F1-type ATP synthase assembly protein I